MANINDFKLLNTKCLKYYELLANEVDIKNKNLSETDKKRFGFYIFMLESICNIKDILDLVPLITDKEFNLEVFGNNHNDNGVDAVYINEEDFEINLFNFKFREKFKKDQEQSLNETIITSKFLNAIDSDDSSGLTGALKEYADNIIEKLNSDKIWNLNLYIVSNEIKVLKPQQSDLRKFSKAYDLHILPRGLGFISELMSIRPEDINAKLIVNKDAIMTYSENEMASSKSYVIRLPLSDLIRITCSNNELREQYSIEDIEILSEVDIDYSVLFDNVRGFVYKSKYNSNIELSLKESSEKFFMYNNGLTITAKSIVAKPANASKKFILELKGFQILNGGQTLRTIHKFNQQDESHIIDFLSKSEVLVRIFSVEQEDGTLNKIAEYTNSQNSISNVDLKSLRPEQIQLEQYLDEKGIIYARKSGDTGLNPEKKYDHKISMERFGQILFSLKGYPEKASNQKKQIFDKKYNDIFGEGSFEIENSVSIIQKYFEIQSEYELTEYKYSDQKAFYILYIDGIVDNKNLSEQIEFLERNLDEFETENELSHARKLIQSKFREVIDKNISSWIKNS